jgi:hypothetical protein
MPVLLSFNGAFLFSSILFARTASNANPFPMHNRKAAQKPINSLLNLSGNLRLGVGDLDTQLLSTGNDVNSLSGGDVVGNLGGVGSVVHQEKLNIANVADEESLVAGRSHEAGLSVGTIANRGHSNGTAESSSDSAVDTLGLAPAGVHALEAIRLMPLEALRALLDDGNVLLGGNHLKSIKSVFVID